MTRITDKDKLAKFTSIVQSLGAKDRVVIIHDSDADGIGSGLLFERMLSNLKIPVVDMVSHINRAFLLDDKNRERIIDCKPTIIFSTDTDLAQVIGFDELYQQLQIPFVIQDHHALNPKYDKLTRSLYLNPIAMSDMTDGGDYCSAKFVYDLCNNVHDMSPHRYLAVMGILGDHCAAHWHDFLTQTAIQEQLPTHDDPQDWYTSKLAKPQGLIFSAGAVDQETYEQVFKKIRECKTFTELHDFAQHNPHDYIQKEIAQFIESYEEHLQKDEQHNIYFISHESPYHISSVLCTVLSLKDLDGIWLVFHGQGDFMRINARNQSKRVHLGKTLRKVCAQFPHGNGGGHAAAAGGRVLTKDVPDFIEKFKKALNSPEVSI